MSTAGGFILLLSRGLAVDVSPTTRAAVARATSGTEQPLQLDHKAPMRSTGLMATHAQGAAFRAVLKPLTHCECDDPKGAATLLAHAFAGGRATTTCTEGPLAHGIALRLDIAPFHKARVADYCNQLDIK